MSQYWSPDRDKLNCAVTCSHKSLLLEHVSLIWVVFAIPSVVGDRFVWLDPEPAEPGFIVVLGGVDSGVFMAGCVVSIPVCWSLDGATVWQLPMLAIMSNMKHTNASPDKRSKVKWLEFIQHQERDQTHTHNIHQNDFLTYPKRQKNVVKYLTS